MEITAKMIRELCEGFNVDGLRILSKTNFDDADEMGGCTNIIFTDDEKVYKADVDWEKTYSSYQNLTIKEV